ncbi:MAG: pitrilysin family protein [Anaerolineae bacterium]|nr:pitrilysin family protein [Anaerolineae bacterium]
MPLLHTSNGVLQATLDNGLVVLLRPMHHAPVVSFWVWYRVGSRLEAPPATGLTHWVEHMLFRGTERFPGPSVHKLVARAGGNRNGFTSFDYTAYFETLPADQADLALELEADRMLNARFDPEAVEAERTIILSERAGNENSPSYRLREALLAAAFPGHGYGHPIIGWEADLRRITRDELWEHYRRYYGPDNAVVAAAGDFDPDHMLERVVERFGGLAPRRGDDPATGASASQRPAAAGRRVVVTGREPVAYVQMLFPAPPATHPDYFPLAVLDAVLGGAKAMGFGGGATNRSSRLYRRLVAGGLAASVGCSVRPTVEPFAFAFSATVRHGVDPQAVEDALWREIEAVASEPVSAAELERARKQTQAQFAYSADSVSSQGYWLGFSQVVATTQWFLDFPGRLAAVTAADVQRAAQTYLRRDQAVVGWYQPERRR